MTTKEPAARVAAKVATLAAEIDVSPEQVCRWIRAGLLIAFVSPDDPTKPASRGKKGYRIFRDEWERFLRANEKTGRAAPAPMVAAPSRWSGLGLDGVDRLKRGRKS